MKKIFLTIALSIVSSMSFANEIKVDCQIRSGAPATPNTLQIISITENKGLTITNGNLEGYIQVASGRLVMVKVTDIKQWVATGDIRTTIEKFGQGHAFMENMVSGHSLELTCQQTL